MINQHNNTTMRGNELLVRMVFDRWNSLIKNCDTLIYSLSDEQLLKEIAPEKNRGVYILGHLIAVHDSMLPLLDLGEKQYSELFDTFITSPDKAVEPLPSPEILRAIWKKQLETMQIKFEAISIEGWFSRHTAVPENEFLTEPHRNKLNILLTRSTHLAYHWGQLMLLK